MSDTGFGTGTGIPESAAEKPAAGETAVEKTGGMPDVHGAAENAAIQTAEPDTECMQDIPLPDGQIQDAPAGEILTDAAGTDAPEKDDAVGITFGDSATDSPAFADTGVAGTGEDPGITEPEKDACPEKAAPAHALTWEEAVSEVRGTVRADGKASAGEVKKRRRLPLVMAIAGALLVLCGILVAVFIRMKDVSVVITDASGLVAEYTVSADCGTVADVLDAAAEDGLEYSLSEKGVLVTVNGKEASGTARWVVEINGKYSNYGVLDEKVHDGDVITVTYTVFK